MVGRSNATQHQNMRRAKRSCAQNNFISCLDDFSLRLITTASSSDKLNASSHVWTPVDVIVLFNLYFFNDDVGSDVEITLSFEN